MKPLTKIFMITGIVVSVLLSAKIIVEFIEARAHKYVDVDS